MSTPAFVPQDPGRVESGHPPSEIVLLNNSRETFTPTVSGAIATCLWEVCRAASNEGVHPRVLTRGTDAATYDWAATTVLDPAPVPRALRGRGGRARCRLDGWARVDQRAYAVAARAALRELRPAVVFCNNDPEVAAWLSRELPGTQVVHWFHNLELTSDRWRRRFSADRRLRSVAVSAYLARAVEMVYGLAPRSVAAVHNGVDGERLAGHRDGRDHPDHSDHRPPVVGFLGRVAVEKAPDTLLRAALRLAAEGTPFELQLVGDTNWGRSSPGPYRDEVDRLVTELDEAGVTVRRPGHVSRADVPKHLARADIHVVPSRWDEPCGLTVLEGMASGLAVVASATGGTPELLGDAGRLFPRDDVDALADQLRDLLTDPAALKRAQTAALARSRELTWTATWRGLAAVAGVPSGSAAAEVAGVVGVDGAA